MVAYIVTVVRYANIFYVTRERLTDKDSIDKSKWIGLSITATKGKDRKSYGEGKKLALAGKTVTSR